MVSEVIEAVKNNKLIAICRAVPPEKILAVADALYAGGFRLMELAFDQSRPDTWSITAQSIRAIAEKYKGRMFVGAGTVLTPELVDLATENGASFIVSPDYNQKVVAHTKALGLCSIPGAMTPSEITAAYYAGADFIKLFPICDLGLGYLRSIRAPLSHIPLLAVGNVNAETLGDYLRAGCVGAAIGGCVVNKKYIASGEYEKITEMAEKLMKIAKGEE